MRSQEMNNEKIQVSWICDENEKNEGSANDSLLSAMLMYVLPIRMFASSFARHARKQLLKYAKLVLIAK